MKNLASIALWFLIVTAYATEPIEGDFFSMKCRPRMDNKDLYMASVVPRMKAGEMLDIVLKDQGLEISPRDNDLALWKLLNPNRVYSFTIVKPGIRTEWGLSGWYEIIKIEDGQRLVYERTKPNKPVDPTPVPPLEFLRWREPVSEFPKTWAYDCCYAFETNFDAFRAKAEKELRSKGYAFLRDDRSMGPRSVEFRRKDDSVTIYQDMRYRPPRFGEPYGTVGYDEKGWVSLQVVWGREQRNDSKTEPPAAAAGIPSAEP